jgi:putative FmdB family regulatory protein|tara:strand:- start:272 stop:475 length:204 start_codon:yes stop_codon:yes gene_type:complete
MPLYVYKCEVCQAKVEILQPFGEPCPHCTTCKLDDGTSVPMKKQIALTSFSLKGDGWAKDNYGLKKS